MWTVLTAGAAGLTLRSGAAAVRGGDRLLTLRGGDLSPDGDVTPPSFLMPPAINPSRTDHESRTYQPSAALGEYDVQRWEVLRGALRTAAEQEGAAAAEGAAAKHSPAAREEAAAKLIGNHVNVLKDVCHPSPMSQTGLCRVSTALSHVVDRALRETARRLLGPRSALDAVPPESPASEEEAAAWRAMADFVHARLQSSADQHPGRGPDMSAAAAAAMRDVLMEVGGAPCSTTPAPERPYSDGTGGRLLTPFFSSEAFQGGVEATRAA
jgi:hypothetical protein